MHEWYMGFTWKLHLLIKNYRFIQLLEPIKYESGAFYEVVSFRELSYAAVLKNELKLGNEFTGNLDKLGWGNFELNTKIIRRLQEKSMCS